MHVKALLVLFASIAVQAQEPPEGFQRTEGQQRYVDRRLSGPPPVVRVHGQGAALGPSEARTAAIFGSLGLSAAWSIGALHYRPQLWLRKIGASSGILIHFGAPDGFLVNKGDGVDLGGAGEKVGLMLYGVFRVAVPPGDYELYEALNWRGGIDNTSATGREKFRPIRFRAEAGRPVYLGRLAFVPRVVPLPATLSRVYGHETILPTYKVDGFQIWVRDAADADRQLARIDASPVESLIATMVDQGGGFFRREVTYEEIDHNGRSMH